MLDFLEKPGNPFQEYEPFMLGAVLWGQGVETKSQERALFHPETRDWLMSEPLPEGFDEALESRLVNLLRRHHVGSFSIAKRLSALPLTSERVKTLLELTLSDGSFYHLERCEEIARIAGPQQVEIPRPRRMNPVELAAYAVLVGDPSCFSKWADEAIATSDYWSALRLLQHDERLRTPSRVEALHDLVVREDLSCLPSLHADHPWLLTEADVLRQFMDPARSEEQWARLTSVPSFIVPVLEAKAVSTTSTYLGERLFEQIDKLDIGPHQRAKLAVERVIAKGPESIAPHRVGGSLGSGKLWSEHGKALLEHFIRQDGARGVPPTAF